MGLYDKIRCEYPLPNPEHRDLEFQTKDLDCTLDVYVISETGQLIRRTHRGRTIREYAFPFHGDIRFYALDPDRTGGLIEYVARFTDGRLEWIRASREGGTSVEEPAGAAADPCGPDRWPGLAPELHGRRLTAEEFQRHAPDKVELIAGEISEVESLLWLALTNLGLRRAARLVGPDLWRRALDDEA